MNLVFPNTGLLQIATNAVLNLWPTLYFGLYTNAVAIGPGTVWANLTEASWTGYARQIGSGWTVNGIVANIAVQSAAGLTFQNTGSGAVSCYGYFMINTTGPILVAIAEFDNAPVAIAGAGGTLNFTPVIGDYSQYTSA